MHAGPGPLTAVLAWLLALVGMVTAGAFIDHARQPLLAVLTGQAAAALPVLLLLPLLSSRDLGLGGATRAWLALGLLFGLVGCVLSALAHGLVLVFAGPPPPQPVEQVIVELHAWGGWPGLLLLAALLPGVVEEVLFRGVVLHGLRRNLSSGAAIVVCALLFAALHLSPWRFLPQFAFGCLLGWLALRSGSVWPAAIAHAAHNAVWLAVERLLRPVTGA